MTMTNYEIIQKLAKKHNAEKEEFIRLLTSADEADFELLGRLARKLTLKIYGNKIFIRGLIEISSYCKNDCIYCGIRRSNKNAVRYRLDKEQILQCCNKGYKLGFRTFVMQGGEDKFFTDDYLCDVIKEIKKRYPDCAVTLSLGERGEESFKRLYAAGADRYLLRHETADNEHYKKLHPQSMSLANRKKCLFDLKKIGYQTGAGFMVGSPYQTAQTLCEDLLFLKELNPQMCGIGPFIPHHDTPFADKSKGSTRLTLMLLSIVRLLLPNVLLPATTALATAQANGHKEGVLHGANVIMPNLSPLEHRKDYSLYDNKISTGDEAAESVEHLKKSMKSIGYEVVTDRGDYKS